MAILDEIEVHVKAGRLITVQPLSEIRAHRAQEERRTLHVSQKVYEFLKSDRRLAAETEADFDDFVLGKSFDVCFGIGSRALLHGPTRASVRRSLGNKNL